MSCPFCGVIAEGRWLLESRHAVAIADAYPLTPGHSHLHVIPRFRGDVPEPRGGVRWIIPEKAPYWR